MSTPPPPHPPVGDAAGAAGTKASPSPRTPRSPRLVRLSKTPELIPPSSPPGHLDQLQQQQHDEFHQQQQEQHQQQQPASPIVGQQPAANAVDDDVDEGIGDDESNLSSTYSLTDSILDYRNLHGRTYQSSRTTEYWGPNDDHQNDGLDIAHHFITMLLGDRLYEAPLENPTAILDVGTGTGIWAIDMADAFPAAEVTGFDIAPIQPEWVPPNCKFHIDDAQLEWTYRDAEFDFVHIRALYGSIADWPALYREAFRTLRPGGYLENFEFTILLRSDEPSVNDDPEHIFKQWADVFYQAADRLGKTIKIGMDGRMRRYMEEAGFEDIVVTDHKLPCGPWSDDPRLKEVGMYNLAFMEQSLEGFALFLLKEIMGWDYVEVQLFLARMRRAIKDMKLKPYYIVPNVYARKPLNAI